MEKPLAQDKQVLKGEYSLDPKEHIDPNNPVNLQFYIYHDREDIYASDNSNHLLLTYDEVQELVNDLQEFLDRYKPIPTKLTNG